VEPVAEAVVEDAAPEDVTPEAVPEQADLKAPDAVEWTPPPVKKPAARKKPAAEEPAAEAEPVVTGKTSVKDGWMLPVALLLVAVLLGGLGTFFLVKSRSVSYDAALVDAATTSEVNGQVREAVEKSFSYNFADVESTEKAARELLTGKALCQYNAVFGPVKEVAPQQKLVVTVRVVSSAVSSLRDDRATVLVFADQVTTRTTDNQSGGGTAMLRVSAVDDGGRWKIDNMEMFGATADQNRQLQGC
jgi:Mce-associated membrane protein